MPARSSSASAWPYIGGWVIDEVSGLPQKSWCGRGSCTYRRWGTKPSASCAERAVSSSTTARSSTRWHQTTAWKQLYQRPWHGEVVEWGTENPPGPAGRQRYGGRGGRNKGVRQGRSQG